MTTDEEKVKIAKLLQNIEVPEVKLSERSSELVAEYYKKFLQSGDVLQNLVEEEVFENPYKINKRLLEENERKLQELNLEGKRYLFTFIIEIVLRFVQK